MRSRNHIRSCANDSGSSPERSTGTTLAAPACRAAATSGPNSRMRGFSNRVRSSTSRPSRSAIRDTAMVARREWPPRSKKLSSMPTRSTPSTSAQISATTRSVASRGAMNSAPPAAARSRSARSPSGRAAGRAARSSLPEAFTGSASSATKSAGTA